MYTKSNTNAFDDSWNVNEEQPLSESWIGFTRFTLLNTPPPEGHTWAGRRLTKLQTAGSDHIWLEVWSDKTCRKSSLCEAKHSELRGHGEEFVTSIRKTKNSMRLYQKKSKAKVENTRRISHALQNCKKIGEKHTEAFASVRPALLGEFQCEYLKSGFLQTFSGALMPEEILCN